MRIAAVLFFILFSLGARADGLHVVFDLDGTLISPASDATPDDDPRQFVEAAGERYRIQDFAPEVLAALRDAGYKISFFSGGEKTRNHAVVAHLQKLVMDRTGRALVPFKVLSRDDLTPVFGRPDSARFRERFRKDLQRIDFPGDVVIVDDLPQMIMPGQERNVVAISPDSKTVRERQKLLVVMEIMLGAREFLTRAPLQYLQAVRGLAAGTAPGAGYDDEAFVELMRKALTRLGLPLRVTEPAYPTYLRTRSCGKVFTAP